MFHAGATALRQYVGDGDSYVCPLCLWGFNKHAVDTADLTIEHVPPASLGGQGILLTCRNCNTTSGRTLDSEMVKRDRFRRFTDTIFRGDSSYHGPAVLESAGERFNVELYRNGKFIVLANNLGRNSPATVERWKEKRLMNFQLSCGVRYHPTQAALGDLRTAYLAAFALLGYRYVLQPAFNIVREQIIAPESRLIQAFSFVLDPGTTINRQVFEFSNPHCIGVQLDRVVVLLPVPGSSDDLYNRLASKYRAGDRADVSGRSDLGWPTGLELREDFGMSRLPPPPLVREEQHEG